MNQIPIKLGPLALLLTVISICLTTLSILTFTTASADMRLAQRFADTVSERYALEMKGQEFLAQARASVSEGDTIFLMDLRRKADGSYENVIEEGDSHLTIGFTVAGQEVLVTTWQLIRDWQEDDSLNVWQGGW
jgi:hypothetical protein